MYLTGSKIKTFVLLSLVADLAVIPLITVETMASDNNSDSGKMLQASGAATQFALKFMKEVPSGTNANLIFSPISMQTLMNMVLLGATDNSVSQKELLQVLGYNEADLASDRLKPHQAMSKALSSLKPPEKKVKESSDDDDYTGSKFGSQRGDPVNISLANSVLYNTDLIELKQDYVSELATYYAAQTERFNMSSLDGLSGRVNSWVEEKTSGKIKRIVGDDELNNANLMMVLLNAAHFKGAWLEKFNKKSTNYKQFFNLGMENNIKQVEFMRHVGDYGYADLTPTKNGSETSASALHKLNCQVLSMPFANPGGGEKFSMVILLPKEIDGLAKLEATLDNKTLSEVYELLDSEREVDVRMPKFSLESSLDAKNCLDKMGLKAIFSSAHLDRMHKILPNVANNVVTVDKIIHKAMIKVDEDGAEAAAVSMSMIMLMSLNIKPQPAPIFEANRPFLFIIRHDNSNLPIFMGRVSEF